MHLTPCNLVWVAVALLVGWLLYLWCDSKDKISQQSSQQSPQQSSQKETFVSYRKCQPGCGCPDCVQITVDGFGSVGNYLYRHPEMRHQLCGQAPSIYYQQLLRK